MDHHFIVSAPIENYAEQYSNAEPPLLKELRQETYAKMAIPQMLSGPLEGAFLKLLILATSSKHVLEIGTFTGYSALMMAEAVSEDGEVVTCEIDVETAKFAQKYFDKSPYGKKIRLKVGAASEILKTLKPNFDFIFCGCHLVPCRAGIPCLSSTSAIDLRGIFFERIFWILAMTCCSLGFLIRLSP